MRAAETERQILPFMLSEPPGLLRFPGNMQNDGPAINSEHSAVDFGVFIADKVRVQSVGKIDVDQGGFTGQGEDADVFFAAVRVGRYKHVTGECLNFIGAVCEDGAFLISYRRDISVEQSLPVFHCTLSASNRLGRCFTPFSWPA